MRLARFDDDRLGLVNGTGDGLIDITDRLGIESPDPVLECIRGDYTPSEHQTDGVDYAIDEVTLEAPIRRPGKIIAAPLNYEPHIEESIADEDIDLGDWFSIEDFGYFLKAPSSIIGPEDSIVLPFTDRRVDHEIELAFVIGEETKDITAEDAWERIHGYMTLLDITVRGEQDRSNRKSYDTFTVTGPWLVTADAVPAPQNLDLRLAVNDEIRQNGTTADMVYSCADIIQYASIGTTLEPGDVITTGTPAGVGPLADGDVIDTRIEGLGSMTVSVIERDVSFADLAVTKTGLRNE